MFRYQLFLFLLNIAHASVLYNVLRSISPTPINQFKNTMKYCFSTYCNTRHATCKALVCCYCTCREQTYFISEKDGCKSLQTVRDELSVYKRTLLQPSLNTIPMFRYETDFIDVKLAPSNGTLTTCSIGSLYVFAYKTGALSMFRRCARDSLQGTVSDGMLSLTWQTNTALWDWLKGHMIAASIDCASNDGGKKFFFLFQVQGRYVDGNDDMLTDLSCNSTIPTKERPKTTTRPEKATESTTTVVTHNTKAPDEVITKPTEIVTPTTAKKPTTTTKPTTPTTAKQTTKQTTTTTTKPTTTTTTTTKPTTTTTTKPPTTTTTPPPTTTTGVERQPNTTPAKTPSVTDYVKTQPNRHATNTTMKTHFLTTKKVTTVDGGSLKVSFVALFSVTGGVLFLLVVLLVLFFLSWYCNKKKKQRSHAASVRAQFVKPPVRPGNSYEDQNCRFDLADMFVNIDENKRLLSSASNHSEMMGACAFNITPSSSAGSQYREKMAYSPSKRPLPDRPLELSNPYYASSRFANRGESSPTQSVRLYSTIDDLKLEVCNP